MDNCLKTTLKGVVVDNTLPYFNAIAVEIVSQTTPDYASRNFNVRGKSGISGVMKVVSGNVYFTNSTGTTNLGTSKALSEGNNDTYISNGDGIIIVEDKEHIESLTVTRGGAIKLNMSNFDFLDSFYLNARTGAKGDIPGNTKFSFFSAENSVGLTGEITQDNFIGASSVVVSGTKLYGEFTIGSLLSMLIISNTNIAINTEDIETSNLTVFNARNCANVIGITSELANGKLTDIDVRDTGIEGSVESYCEADYGRIGSVVFVAGIKQPFHESAQATTYHITFASDSVIVRQTNASGTILGTYNGNSWSY